MRQRTESPRNPITKETEDEPDKTPDDRDGPDEPPEDFAEPDDREEKPYEPEEGLDKVTLKRALAIGLGQCFAVFPGASRSMTTIVSGELSGLSTSTAAEFSFLLSIPTITAATLYKGWKERHILADTVGPLNIAVGTAVSFFVAWAVIAGFLGYLKKHGLAPFGVYRIVVGALLLWVASH